MKKGKRMLIEKLEKLRETLITQANIVEKMISQCRRGLAEREEAAFQDTIQTDEPAVNRFELSIDELCLTFLALYQPEAKDLRMVMMISKMTSDLERMGDCAVNIAESGLFLLERPEIIFTGELAAMAEEASRMLSDSMRAFIDENAALARDVCRRDAFVDKLRDKIWHDLSRLGESDRPAIETALHVLRIANNFEKIADLTTNIAEETVFIAAGSVIKHHADEDVPDSSIYH